MSNNKCYRCREFDRYYVKGLRRFDKINIGMCYVKGESVDAQGGCDKFVPKKPVRKTRYALTVCLNNIMADISAVRNIIEEEASESEEL